VLKINYISSFQKTYVKLTTQSVIQTIKSRVENIMRDMKKSNLILFCFYTKHLKINEIKNENFLKTIYWINIYIKYNRKYQ